MQLQKLQSEDTTAESPSLSIIITVVSGAKHLDDCISALSKQENYNMDKVEIIVPFDESDQAIPQLASKYPHVIFHARAMSFDGPAGLCHEHFDELRSTGFHLARGNIMALLVDHEVPAPNWCENMMAEHTLPYAAVGGAVENLINHPLNWAVYFFDFGRYQNPLTSGYSSFLTDVNISYKRESLMKIKHTWEHIYHEPVVHGALLAGGETLWLSQHIVVYQHRTCLTFSDAMQERYTWGRYFSGNRVASASLAVRMTYCLVSPAIPVVILLKMFRNALEKRRLTGTFLKVLPVTILLTLSWSWGEFIGYVTGRPSSYTQGGNT